MFQHKVSRGLDTLQVRSMHDAWHRAYKAGWPLNRLVSIRPIKIDELDPDDRYKLFAKIRNKLGVYARLRRFLPSFIWSREINKDGTGEHMHVLMYVPARWQQDFEDTLVGWYPGPAEMDVQPATQKTRCTCNGRRLSAINYISKQMTPQAAYKRGLIRKAGGPITGKRAGMTQDLQFPDRPRRSEKVPQISARQRRVASARR